MIKPQDVKHKKYPVDAILFESEKFSIVWGTWEEKTKLLGMRWNTSNENDVNDVGYPKTFGHPVWFMIPEELTATILNGLMTLDSTNKSRLQSVINEVERINRNKA